MSSKRVDAVEQLFLSFNREVGKNRSLVDNYLTNLQGIDTDILVKAVNHLSMNSDRLPRWTEVKTYCDSQRVLQKGVSVECSSCWGIGMVYGVFYDGNEVFSDNYQPDIGGYYYSAVTGRCGCDNGAIYTSSMPVSRYSEFVKREFATGKYIAPAQACSEIVVRKNRQNRELAKANTEG